MSRRSGGQPGSWSDDLNKLHHRGDTESYIHPIGDPSILSLDGNTEAIFRQVRRRLIQEIDRWPIIFGCVAWLTDSVILDALATRHWVALVVQKEDLFRPDLPDSGDQRIRKAKIRKAYDKLPAGSRYAAGDFISQLSFGADHTLDAVRCVGNFNRQNQPAFPRMHHKFVVFCDADEHSYPIPQAVWTGSFNFSINATRSLENAVILRDLRIVQAYFEEFEIVVGLSEPLDWESDWSEPEYRIGS